MSSSGISIRRATAEDAAELAAVLVDVVAGGASVGFLHPVSDTKALAYVHGALASAARGERIVLVARQDDSPGILGTVQLVLNMPENQPHRADVAKLQVLRAARGRGIARALMRAVEEEARRERRSLLVLDTATGSDAERLYAALGWQRCGVIPGYALWPDGDRLCDTTLFCRQLRPAAPLALEGADRGAILRT